MNSRRASIRGDLCVPTIDKKWELSGLVVRYLASCIDRNLSEHSVRAYRNDLTQFMTSSVTKSIPNRSDLAAFKALILPLSPASKKRKLMSLSAFCTWLEEEEIVASQIYKKSDFRVQLPKRLPRNLTRTEVEDLLAKMRGDSNGLLIVRLLVSTGVRVAEFCSLRVGDFNPESGTFRITGKGNKQRTVPLTDKSTLGRLATYLRRRGGDRTSALFLNRHGDPVTPQNIRALLHKYAPGVTPHMLRHTCATLYCEAGMNVRHVQSILGHSSLAITERYMHVSEGSLVAATRSHPLKISAARVEQQSDALEEPAIIRELYGNSRYRDFAIRCGADDPDSVIQESAIAFLKSPPPADVDMVACCLTQIKHAAYEQKRREGRQERGGGKVLSFEDLSEAQKKGI